MMFVRCAPHLHALPGVVGSGGGESNGEDHGCYFIWGVEPDATVDYSQLVSCQILGVYQLEKGARHVCMHVPYCPFSMAN